MEAIVFVGGIGINENTSIWAIVNGAVTAIALGSLIGIVLYRSGNTLPLRWFLISSTCLLYLVAAGLFSKGVWNFELQRFIDKCDGFDVSETGHGPGLYDIGQSVWHVNCCNGELQDDGPYWMMATAILGWTNSATYGSVSSYILYWVTIIAVFSLLTYEERHGRLPLVPLTWQKKRILKRMRFMNQNLPVQEHARESIDSVNSRTPLQN
jgi:high-affinity iron transporter